MILSLHFLGAGWRCCPRIYLLSTCPTLCHHNKKNAIRFDRTSYRPNASSELVDILVRKRVKASEIDMHWYPGQRQYFDLMDVGVLSAKETDLFTTLFFPPILGFSEEMSESFAHAYSLNYKYDCSRRRPQAISCCLTKI